MSSVHRNDTIWRFYSSAHDSLTFPTYFEPLPSPPSQPALRPPQGLMLVETVIKFVIILPENIVDLTCFTRIKHRTMVS